VRKSTLANGLASKQLALTLKHNNQTNKPDKLEELPKNRLKNSQQKTREMRSSSLYKELLHSKKQQSSFQQSEPGE
jgi:hypothetical protein